MITSQLSPIERASNRWWKIEIPEVEGARHVRFMEAIRRIDPKPKPVQVGPWEPGFKWRYLEHENANEVRRSTCTMCKQTGEITVGDGYGCIEVDLCPNCQHSNPFRRRRVLADVSDF